MNKNMIEDNRDKKYWIRSCDILPFEELTLEQFDNLIKWNLFEKTYTEKIKNKIIFMVLKNIWKYCLKFSYEYEYKDKIN